MLQLRPYQFDMIQQARAHFKAGRKRVLLQLPTGGGKTAMTSTMVNTATRKNGKRVWFAVHRRELVNQVCKAFDKEGLEYGVISADYAVNKKPLAQIVSVQTIIRRLERFDPPDLLVVDECHHAASASWIKLMKHCKDSHLIGLSATPRRLDGAGLGAHFDEMVVGPSMRWLIENSYLAPYRLFAPQTVDMTGVNVVAGDFNRKKVIERVTDSKIVGDAVAHYRKHCDGARAVVFAASVEHAKQVAEKFREKGVPSTFFDGNTEKGLRDQINSDFATGHIRVLCNCELLGEGYDLPAIEAAILLRPTMSESLYLQQVGRALRYVEGKTAILLDHVGNCQRHGLPDDERKWALEYTGGPKKARDGRPPPQLCAHCFASSKASATKCETCGRPFESEGRKVEEVDGELVETALTPQQLERREQLREQGGARSLQQLIELGVMRYGPDKGPRWAQHVYEARQKKRGVGTTNNPT